MSRARSGRWSTAAGRQIDPRHGADGALDPARHHHIQPHGVLAIIAVTTILVVGIKESANFNTTIVFVKLIAVIVFIIVAGMYAIKQPDVAHANWAVFLPKNTGSFGSFGWSGVLRGAGVVFFAYIGFDAVSTAAQEAREPPKDMPVGILGSLAICTVLYIVVSVVLTGLVKFNGLNVPDPLAVGIDRTGVAWGSITPHRTIHAKGAFSSHATTRAGASRVAARRGRCERPQLRGGRVLDPRPDRPLLPRQRPVHRGPHRQGQDDRDARARQEPPVRHQPVPLVLQAAQRGEDQAHRRRRGPRRERNARGRDRHPGGGDPGAGRDDRVVRSTEQRDSANTTRTARSSTTTARR